MHTLQARMDQLSAEHATERERLADRTRLAEERFADMEKRALVEIDREGTAPAKLQKRHDSVETLNYERDRERAELQAVRTDPGAAVWQAAGDSERVDQLRDELERAGRESSARQKPSTRSKRQSKESKGGGT